ncbi:MAG: GHKL domain-containing protein [Sphingosinicella sp.]|nr:GHKL domain-containing protein [Sphingosinicella sp.]
MELGYWQGMKVEDSRAVNDRGDPILKNDPLDLERGGAGAASARVGTAPFSANYEKMYERTSSMAGIGVWEFDLLTHELRWTDAIYDLFEIPRGSPIERSQIVRFYEEESRVEMERLRSHAIATGGSFGIDIQLTTLRGTQRWVHLTAEVEQEGGKSVRIFGTKQDVTERKAAQEQVRLLQKELIHSSGRNAMSTMAATLAHELNQPIAAIANYASGVNRLLEEAETPHLVAHGLKEIEANALRAGEIIRRMRLMAERGKGRTEQIDLVTLLLGAVNLACSNKQEISFDYRFSHKGLAVGDSVQVEQIAINLIRNACEALEGSDVKGISISTDDDGDQMIISVSDTGPGIPDHRKLFEATQSDKQHGMGIGLSICRTIVEANGGRIWAEPCAQGAIFRFSLPKADAGALS